MNDKKWPELEADFRAWSGGFPPESEYQITVYIDYANSFQGRDDEVRRYLTDWYERDDGDAKRVRQGTRFGSS